MLFAGAHAAVELAREPDAVIVARFLDDLHALYPASRGIVADAVVHRWELGNVFARPGRHLLQAPLEGALGPHRNLHPPRRRLLRRARQHGGRRPDRRPRRAARRRAPPQPSARPRSIVPDQFHGVLPALVTPFTEDGAELDAGALAAIVDRLVAAAPAASCPAGAPASSPRSATPSGGGSSSSRSTPRPGACRWSRAPAPSPTAETIELSVHAERAGAAAVMIVPPFYDPLGLRELLAHYRAVAAGITIPIVDDNLPAATGVTVTPDQLRELRRVAGVTALKDTGATRSPRRRCCTAATGCPRCSTAGTPSRSLRWPPACAPSSGARRLSSRSSASRSTGC